MDRNFQCRYHIIFQAHVCHPKMFIRFLNSSTHYCRSETLQLYAEKSSSLLAHNPRSETHGSFMLRSARHLPTIAHRIISLETLHGLTRMPSSNLSTVKPDLFPADPACAAKRNFFPLFCSDSFLIKSPHTNTLLNQCAQPVSCLALDGTLRGYH